VTIVTPSLNQRRFLEDALLSVANQTYPHLEHLVVDGGSTDGTLDLLQRYESRYALQWSSGRDAGQSEAVNKGFAAARGEIIGWLNADDVYFTRDVIESAVEAFAATPTASVVYGDCALISRNGTIFRIVPAMSHVTRARLRYHSISQPAVFFTRRIVQGHPLRQDLHYLLDYEYWLRLCATEVFVHLEKIVAAYRVYPDSKSFKSSTRIEEEWRQVWREYFGADGEPTGWGGRMRQRSTALQLRMRGLGRLGEAYQRPLAFPGLTPSRPWLLFQQLLVPLDVYARGFGWAQAAQAEPQIPGH